MQGVVRELGLSNAKIIFKRCRNRDFSASDDRVGGVFYAYITFPERNRAGYQPIYATPIAHELGHAVQMRDAGSQGTLRSLLALRDIELGADFLAGLALRRTRSQDSIMGYVTNLDLRGKYEIAVDDHGRPIERTNAFRRGYYRDARIGGRETAQAAHLAFQLSLRTDGGP